MADNAKFLQTVKDGYAFKGENFKIGCAMLDGEVMGGADVLIPFKTMNRHGLIAGATGTGKTKTLQVSGRRIERCQRAGAIDGYKGRFEWHCRRREQLMIKLKNDTRN